MTIPVTMVPEVMVLMTPMIQTQMMAVKTPLMASPTQMRPV